MRSKVLGVHDSLLLVVWSFAAGGAKLRTLGQLALLSTLHRRLLDENPCSVGLHTFLPHWTCLPTREISLLKCGRIGFARTTLINRCDLIPPPFLVCPPDTTPGKSDILGDLGEINLRIQQAWLPFFSCATMDMQKWMNF